MKVKRFFSITVMIFLFVLYPVLNAVIVQTLTIDSQLGTSIEDCFERISIGEHLPSSAIYRNVSELTIQECEQICKQDIQCQIYDYGVGAKGNASCNLSKSKESETKDQLIRNPDYDVYIRRIQCEQGPPIPLIPLADEPPPSRPGPVHRPVFRPVQDEPRRPDDQHPLADEFHRPQDLRPNVRPPYGFYRPFGYKPVNNYLDERPDCFHQRPENDYVTGYGQHRPQDIPFQPNRPPRPVYNQSRPKPDPYYDVLNFQDPYYRPSLNGPGYWRPDPYFPPSSDDEVDDVYGPKPIRPNYPHRPMRPLDDAPNYHYIVRPNRRPSYQNPPKPQEDFGYMPLKPFGGNHRPDNGYGQIQGPLDDLPPSPPYRPSDDDDLYPPRPITKPTYNYNDQYASGYGQNSHYDQSSIHVEIHDPPKPLKPPKRPIPDRPTSSGYGQIDNDDYGSHVSSGYAQGSQSSHHSHSQNSQYYGSSQSTGGYGQNDQSQSSGGTQNEYDRPLYVPVNIRPSRPSYTNQFSQSYGGQSSQSSNQYDNQNYYFTSQKPQKPYRPSQDNDHTGYGNNQGSYASSDEGYHGSNNAGYGSQSTFASNQASYGSNQQSSHNYGSQGSYGSSQYGSQSHTDQNYDRPDLPYDNEPENDDGGYKNNKRPTTARPHKPASNNPPHTNNRPAINDKDRPGYGNPETVDKDRPNNGPDKDKNKPINNQSEINKKPNKHKPSDNDKPDIRPVYEYDLDRPTAGPGYVVRPDGQVVTSRPVSVGDYGNRRPGYGVGRDPGHRLSYEACFRRVLAGKRAVRSHVRRVLRCERLEDCRRECATERRFHCESFNYKLDPSFRGKGLCELMTKPIEEFDLKRDFVEDKDYDFFEVDRNSLEPDCPETLRGPGLLHSGFLSSRPDSHGAGDRKWDRYDGEHDNRGYGGNVYGGNGYGGRRGWNYGNRRGYENYIPYQIGLARSNEDDHTWGQYGGSYGGSNTYYKDRKDFRNSINHWRLSTPRYDDFSSPPQDFDYNNLGRGHTDVDYGYGSWKSSWNVSAETGPSGLSYGETSYYRPKPKVHYLPQDSTDGVASDCSSRRRQGMSLGSGAIRRAVRARNVVACETACFTETEFKCVSYSYRYSTSHGEDNCFLSERQYRGLQLSTDTGSDVYGMPPHRACGVSRPETVESECFWHIRSDAALSGVAVSSSLTVAGLGACEAECIRAGYFCRGFSFRYDAPKPGEDIQNCLLTAHPPSSLDPGTDLIKISGYEMYARGNYGRGCEPAPYLKAYHEKECYIMFEREATLRTPTRRLLVTDRADCAHACTSDQIPIPCYSYSIDTKTEAGITCLLSDVRIFDLKQGVDYIPSPNHWLYSLDLFNRECWPQTHKDTKVGDDWPEQKAIIQDEDYFKPPFSPNQEFNKEPGTLIPKKESFHNYHSDEFINYSEDTQRPGTNFKLIYGPSDKLQPGYNYREEPEFKPRFTGSDSANYRPELHIGQYLPDREPGTVFRSSGFEHSSPPMEQYLPHTGEPQFRRGPGFRPAEPDYRRVRPDFRPAEPDFRPAEPDFRRVGPDFRHLGPDQALPELRPDDHSSGAEGYLPKPDAVPEFRPPKPIVPDSGYGGHRDGDILISWNRYTVSGFPCRMNTTCAQNQVAGHWACEPEGGEIGAWDYCCAPEQRCGYSEGFHKPWCYVGASREQWRPCSDTYYPYYQHQAPHPSLDDHDNEHTNRRGSTHGGYIHIDKPAYPDRFMPLDDKAYWDNIQNVGPDAYYDKHGNFIAYTKVPLREHPHIKYTHNYPPPSGGSWEPLVHSRYDGDSPTPIKGLGPPRYWPVAYLHRGPPPNVTYFKYDDQNTTDFKTKHQNNDTTNRPPIEKPTELKPDNDSDRIEARQEKNTNLSDDKTFNVTTNILNTNASTPPKLVLKPKDNIINVNNSKADVTTIKAEVKSTSNDDAKGIDDKLDDFTDSIVVVDLDPKTDSKPSDVRTLEAEEAQIAAIGRFIASQRSDKNVLEKRSQKELEAKSIAVNEDFNFGNRFPTYRGTIQKVTKEEIERDRSDKSLEVSETAFVRPPRVLPTTDNIRKAMVNGKIFYDATLREQRDLFQTNLTRKGGRKTNMRLDEIKAPAILTNQTFGKKKTVIARNINPVRRVRRIYRKQYNPNEVRRRLLERDRSLKQESNNNMSEKLKS